MRFYFCFALLATVGAVSAAEPKSKPNVVIIVAEELGPRDLGCTGSTYYKTPNLDAFAKKGVKLDEAYTQTQTPMMHFLALRSGRFPDRTVPLAPPDGLPSPPLRPEPKYLPVGKPSEKLVPQWPTIVIPRDAVVRMGAVPNDFARAGYVDLSATKWDEAEFGKAAKAAGAKPFYAEFKLPFFEPTAEQIGKYKPGRPGSQGDPAYAARVEDLDTRFGAILKVIDEVSPAESTFVIFTSQRSGNSVEWEPKKPTTSNAPYREGQGYLYEGGLRVPFLMRGPGIKAGGFPLQTMDLLPTLVGLCGIESKAKYDGIDLSAQFRGEAKADASREFRWHYPLYSQSFGKPGAAIRVGALKLIEYFETDRRELFDLSKDVGEGKNLAAEKPDVVKELAGKLAEWRKEIGANLPVVNPDYKPNLQAKDGSITLPAHAAFVAGTTLRFEPAPHKNTLGYWTNPADTASFEFTVLNPGTFTVSVLQGAGKGSGGAEVEIAVGDSKLKFTVKDTGGFQAFEKREVGELAIVKTGRHTLTVTPKSKPGVAVMDLREVTLSLKKK